MQQAAVNLPSRISVGNKTVRVQQRLGSGNFGDVYKVIDEETLADYALKDVPCLNDSARYIARREAITLNKISHENVIALMEAVEFCDPQGVSHILLLTEYCPGRSLNERLARPSCDETNLKWMSQIAAALTYLHSQGVVHRDLKADNVLLTETEDVKLADFGLAREYTFKQIYASQLDDGSCTNNYKQYYMSSKTGPRHWVAPEVFTRRYTEKADVFSLGTLFYAILTRDFITLNGKVLYGAFVNIPGAGKVGLGVVMAEVDCHIRIEFPSYAQGPYVLQRVILNTLQYDKNDRPSAHEVSYEVKRIRQKQQHSLQQLLSQTTAAIPSTNQLLLAHTTAAFPSTNQLLLAQTTAANYYY